MDAELQQVRAATSTERTPPGVLVGKPRRCFASVTAASRRNEPSFLSQRKDEQMQRKVRDREDALASTPGGVRSPEYHRTSTSIGRIGIELHPSATNGSRGEQPVYQLHGEVQNNESKDPTEHRY